MAYSDQAALAVNETFRARVQLAAVRAARLVRAQVQDENAESSSVFRQRQELALKILRQPDVFTDTLAWALAADPTISLASTDNELQSNVNQILANLSIT
jgi:hypothetical protein